MIFFFFFLNLCIFFLNYLCTFCKALRWSGLMNFTPRQYLQCQSLPFFLFSFPRNTLKRCLSFIVGWTDKQMCNGVWNGRLPTIVCFSVLKGCGKISLPYSYIFSSSLYIMRRDWWTQQQGGKKEQLPSTTKLLVLKSKMFSGQVNHFRKGLETSLSALVLSVVQFNSFREKGTVALDIFL